MTSSSLISKSRRAAESVRLLARSTAFRRHIHVKPRADLISLGGHYGHWIVPSELLDSTAVCYLIGAGTDISFDLGLIDRFGCTVHTFDPVPEAQEHANRTADGEPRFHMHLYGLWTTDTTVAFHRPVVNGYVSHSATDMHGTAVAFTAEVRSIRSVMSELGHTRIDLMKVSAEGSEYAILQSLADEDIDVRVLAVEYAQPSPRGESERSCDLLIQRGYDIVYAQVQPRIRKLTFVRREAR